MSAATATAASCDARLLNDDFTADAARNEAESLSSASGPLLASVVCMYTNTPDGHFIVVRHPEHASVLLLSPCSGHGFKFASVVGEIAADLLQDRTPPFDLAPFRFGR